MEGTNKTADLGLRPMCLHITYMTAAPIRLYSMINGKRYGAESCTMEPMILTRPQVGAESPVALLLRASGNRLPMFSASVGMPEPANRNMFSWVKTYTFLCYSTAATNETFTQAYPYNVQKFSLCHQQGTLHLQCRDKWVDYVCHNRDYLLWKLNQTHRSVLYTECHGTKQCQNTDIHKHMYNLYM